jgi:hypothetical protein
MEIGRVSTGRAIASDLESVGTAALTTGSRAIE